MPTPAVSILVTVYNRQQFLPATLQSLACSRFQDFEAIITDDCSSDASADIASEFARTDSRVRFYRNEQNLGDYGNRMKAASLARGEYLKYVDSDDLIYPHTLDVMVSALSQHPEAGLALSHSLPEAEEPYPWVLSPHDTWRKQFLGRGCLSCGPTGALIRRRCFEDVGGFRREWGVLSDIDLWLRLAARWPVALLPPGLVWWRRHEGQEFTVGNAAWRYLTDGYRLSIESLSGRDCPLSESERSDALSRVRHVHARRLLALAVRQRQPSLAWRAFRCSGLTGAQLLQGFFPYPR